MAKKSPLNDFMNFVREQGVIGLAVGLAIGAQVTATVATLVDNFVTPIVGWLLGWFGDTASDLARAAVTLGSGEHALTIGWGPILIGIINLLAVAAVIFYVVKGLKLDKLDKKADQ